MAPEASSLTGNVLTQEPKIAEISLFQNEVVWGTQFTAKPKVAGRRKLVLCGGQEAC